MSDRLNYNTLAPAAMKALGGVHVYLHSQADLPKNLIDLAYLRTSQINGCAYCIDMHSHDLIAQDLLGEGTGRPYRRCRGDGRLQ